MTTTTPNQLCPDCGSPVPAAAPEGLCPRCLALVAVDSAGQPAPGTDSLGEEFAARRFFGDYELLGEVARGGMGIVFKARQLGVNRVVALKVLAGGAAAGREFVHRFHNEAASAARLEHPHIVPIYEFGEHEGTHFLAMRFLEGGTLQTRVAKEMPAPAEAARTIITLASAVEHAHRRGVLHRDLKPGNVLLDGAGAPHVADFGLARVMEDEDTLTLSRGVIGTAAYLAPEVAGGGAACATVASDIYGLGAILYELLTGRPPFAGTTIGQTLRAVQDAEPVRPGQIRSAVAPDLETICLKCLEKNPARRYATAQALAEELRRFLNGEPVAARPISQMERTLRWCRRKPVVAGLLAAFCLAVGLGGGGMVWQWRRALQGEFKARQHQYASDMNLVQQVWDEGDLRRAQIILRSYIPGPGEKDLRGFEWRYLWRLCRDQSQLAIGDFPGPVRLALAPGGDVLAAGSGRMVRLLDPSGKHDLGSLSLPKGRDEILTLAFSPAKTNVLATVSGRQVDLWNVREQRITSSLTVSNRAVTIAFSSDGQLLACASGDDQTLELWRLADQTLMWSRPTATPIFAVHFGPGGRVLLSGGGPSCDALSWDRAAGTAEAFPREHRGSLNSISFSPDGRLAAFTSNDSRTTLWDIVSRKVVARLNTPSAGAAIAAVFSKDGRWLITGHDDPTVRLWELATFQQKAIYRGHNASVTGLVLPGNGSIISASLDGTVRFWALPPKEESDSVTSFSIWTRTTSFSPDSRLLATVDWADGSVAMWDLATSRRLAEWRGGDGDQLGFAFFAPNGKTLAAVFGTQIHLLDPQTLAHQGELTNAFDPISLSFSPDSRILALAGLPLFVLHGITNRLAFWELTTKQRVNKLAAAAPFAVMVSFSHDGRTVAVGYLDGKVRLWDFRTERLLATFSEQPDRIWALAFSPDDRWLATGAQGGAVVFYDLRSGEIFQPAAQTPHWIIGLCFSPDGKTLASAEGDGTVKLWNVATRDIALTLRGHLGPLSMDPSFAPNGDWLATASADGTVRLWRAASAGEFPQRQTSVKPTNQ